MLRRLLVVAIVFVAVASVRAGDLNLIWWDDSAHLYNSLGVDVAGTTANGWLFQVIVDTDGLTDVGAMITAGQWQIGTGAGNGAADDVTLVGWNNTWQSAHPDIGGPGVTGPGPGWESLIDEATYASKKVYIRFFDGGTEASPHAGLIYNTAGGWQLSANSTVIPQEMIQLNRIGGLDSADLAGTTHAGGSDGWAATISVPEPGTMALFAIGILTVAARRRRK